MEGENKDLIKISFIGESEKNWYLKYDKQWELFVSTDQLPVCEVRVRDDYAWRIFTKGISKDEAISNSVIIGKEELGIKFFETIAVMA